ncbi:hypothetical protein BG262_06455 [Floricoccus penangensis]|uniref:Glycosyltransferase 2-like domain-containing protein n=1 Tax=Floricoccus penangensis TaxID=1859475 RepID=A0A9Q5JFH9_9LACT|nr:glycosyltransferase [Floricoccus penangensis]OFI45912.1 hypothetical protein BG262_06455 [Floricoccus penangensis]
MSDMIMLSIVIPVYNGSEYIDKCLMSIKEQLFTNFEVIIVDDGSSDSSSLIIDNFVQTDNRFQYHYQKNKGVSAARNKGISLAKGKYLTFIDVDDYYSNNRLYNFEENINNCDYILTNFNYIHVNNGNKNVINKFSIVKDLYIDDIYRNIIENKEIYSYCWNKYYVTDIIKKNNIYFKENIKYGEDLVFNIEYIQHTNDVKILNDYTYNYVYQASSATFSKNLNSLRNKATYLDAIELVLNYQIPNSSRENLKTRYLIEGSKIYRDLMVLNEKKIANQLRKRIILFKIENLSSDKLNFKNYVYYFLNLNFPRFSKWLVNTLN